MTANSLCAHPGRTDSSGGHNDRKNGGYHFHTGGGSSEKPPEMRLENFAYRESAPVSPRTEARTKPKLPPERQILKEIETQKLIQREDDAIELEKLPRFQLHHKSENPYLARELADGGIYWATINMRYKPLNHKKKSIARIEALLDKEDPRSWIDKSGNFELVASFVKESNGSVTLKKLDGTLLSIQMDRLSETDVAFIKEDFVVRKLK